MDKVYENVVVMAKLIATLVVVSVILLIACLIWKAKIILFICLVSWLITTLIAGLTLAYIKINKND